MSQLTIWRGNGESKVQIYPVNPEDQAKVLELSEIGAQRYNSCQFRDINLTSEIKKTCCSSSVVEGYRCSQYNVLLTDSRRCEMCPFYSAKS